MSKTVSFVAREELAEWLESRASEEMKSVSAVCQDIVADEYRRQQQSEADKEEYSHDLQTSEWDGEEVYEVDFPSKSAADAVRREFTEHLSDVDDRRQTIVRLEPDTPDNVLSEVERRSSG